MDKLIHYVNLNTSTHGINMFYSTQAAYAQARISMQTPLSLKTCDGMPYASAPHSVWSGYFTSRPALKGYVRETSALFTAARQLQAWVAPPADTGSSNPLYLLESSLGVAQHHDAVSGTSKDVVAKDYARRLAQGRGATNAALSTWIDTLLGLTQGDGARGSTAALLPPSGGWVACDLANATICTLTEAIAPVALFL
jgi:hypothetical protein